MATYYAGTSGEISKSEKEHMQLVRELAGECMTLLENDGTLPLKNAGKIALFGNGARHTVKGGTGSGDVNTRSVATIEEGMEAAASKLQQKAGLKSMIRVIQLHRKNIGMRLEKLQQKRSFLKL